MKHSIRIAAVLFLFLPFISTAQNWAWMGGGNEAIVPSYGTIGVEAPGNQPGARPYAMSFKDPSGNLWIFGGWDQLFAAKNDLWKFNVATGNWAWMKGSSGPNPPSVFGTMGVEAPGNTPGGMFGMAAWTDAGGNFWIFNGEMWRFNVSSGNWVYLGGSTVVSRNYGTMGVESPTNNPGVRRYPATWTDDAGNFWLLGGALTVGSGSLCDLWRYNIATGYWTWMSGSSGLNQYGVYGSIGLESPTNMPGARTEAVSWKDASGQLWLYGGSGYAESTVGGLGDLWKYSIASGNWTWMHGSKNANPSMVGSIGVSDPANTPGSRGHANGWTDGSNNLWLFGGICSGARNDLWKYDIGTGIWTWIKGSSTGGNYGTKGVPDASNLPPSNYGGVSWSGSGGVMWLYPGRTYGSGSSAFPPNLWKYNISTNTWTWMSGTGSPSDGVYGSLGITDPANRPGWRNYASSWKGANNSLWLFGGTGNDGLHSDLWKYDIATGAWAWMKGPHTAYSTGVYGTKGSEAETNAPGCRYMSASFTDAGGNFWLFGGNGYAASSSGYLNDLWKYNPVTDKWTWMSGSNLPGQSGNYGTQGLESETNIPGARIGAVTWTDPSGYLWLFGGYGRAASSYGCLNDLWKFNTATGKWTWVSGSNLPDQAGSYGTVGVEAPANSPGARYFPVSWTDVSGNLWLFGGVNGSNGYYDDLWKFNIATGNWTWMKGSSSINPTGVYGTIGFPGSSNCPGGRYGASAVKDQAGNLWLCGGYGYGYSSSVTGTLNDLWMYDIAAGNWTWQKGSTYANQSPVYGEKGIAAPSNNPATYSAVSWFDENAFFWIYGGGGGGDLWRCKLSNPPVALCKNVVVPVVSNCSAPASIDNGSYDPDNDQITITQTPPGPYSVGTRMVTMKVTDEYGRSSYCTGTVTVTGEIPSVTITSTPAIPVNPGGEPNTLYLGYGPQSVTLTANASGAVNYAWYDFDWNYLGSTASVTVYPFDNENFWYSYPYLFYNVFITNQFGCNGGTDFMLTVVDVRCGPSMNKVIVCHRCQNAHTICIDASSVQAHLNHGDYLGNCREVVKEQAGGEAIPSGIVLDQNYPNPFNSATTITYGIPEDGHVRLLVYDIHGRVVAEPVNEEKRAGTHSARLDGAGLPGGVYMYRLEAGGQVRTRMMTLMN
jgi:hypothetical protein